ncbi:MAG: lipopolysaccharide biosynthesis protein [Paraprevotella sp.]|nr:lipopolysaccharide biosynthesis protein [Paraprevotella sp.]
MSDESQNNKRLAKNTLILYARMLFTVGISFYSTRLILANLGVSDYGVYNVIGGFVSMFYMVTSAMTQAVGRFLTFELGRNNAKRLQQTFSTAINILLMLSLVVILLGETVGLWFVNAKLNIEPDRMSAANWIYQFSLLAFIIEMLSVPYSASVISHEKMGTFAFVTIAKVLLTFGIALSLSVSPINKLVFYGILVLAVSMSIQLMYWIYCRRNFPECRYTMHIDKCIFKDMFGFAGWNFLTSCASMLSSQGVSIMLNMHFGTAINAARGVASQINGTAGAFSRNFTTALNPQITKSYAAGDIAYTTKIVCRGAKFSYLLFLFITLPCIFEVDFFLSKWLAEVPPYTGVFVQLTLFNTLTEVLLNSSLTLNRASGKIRKFQVLVSMAQLLILLSSYIVLNITGSPIWTVAMTNIIYLLIFIPRVTVNKPFIGITFKYFFNHVLKGILIVTILSTGVCLLFHVFCSQGWFRLIGTCIISSMTIGITSWLYTLTAGERIKVEGFFRKKFKSH